MDFKPLIVVGHEKEAPGAKNQGTTRQNFPNEFEFNSMVAANLRMNDSTLDILEISHSVGFADRSEGIARYASHLRYTHILELHFNSFTEVVGQRQQIRHHPEDGKVIESWGLLMGAFKYWVPKMTYVALGPNSTGWALANACRRYAKTGVIWEPFFGNDPNHDIAPRHVAHAIDKWLKFHQKK